MWRTFFINIIMCLLWIGEVTAQDDKSAITNSVDTAIVMDNIDFYGGYRKKVIVGTLQGKIEMNPQDVSALPKVFGESDILKVLQLMPGIQTLNEFNSGMFIRGCDTGNQLILYDNAAVYNPSHMLGFFSSFNNSHVTKFSLQKSNVSADAGGRIGGVLKVTSVDTIAKKFSLNADIGIIASSATIGIPLGKKTSLYLSGRKTYINYLLDALSVLEKDDGFDVKYGFDDYNLTLVSMPTKKDKLTLSAYYGSDNFTLKKDDYEIDGGLKWYNLLVSGNWKRKIKTRSELTQTAFFTQYYSRTSTYQGDVKVELPSRVTDAGYKAYFDKKMYFGSWYAGGEYTYHKVMPQYPIVENFVIGQLNEKEIYRTQQIDLFGGVRYWYQEKLKIDASLRYSMLFHAGSYKEKYYNEAGELVEISNFGKGRLHKFRSMPEPRVEASYYFDNSNRVSASYNLQAQYVNKVEVVGLGFPTEFWVAASKNIPPQKAQSFTAGYFGSANNGMFEYSAEAFYKILYNQIEFLDEINEMISNKYKVEDRLLFGRGRSYGLELFVKGEFGNFTPWISYTMSWSQRKFEKINNGNYYPALHDRRHDLSIVAMYKINKRMDCAATFIAATGDAYRVPKSYFSPTGALETGMQSVTVRRMPPYNRLDLSFNCNVIDTKYVKGKINVSLYNAYSRANPVFIWVRIYKYPSGQYSLREYNKPFFKLLPSVSLQLTI